MTVGELILKLQKVNNPKAEILLNTKSESYVDLNEMQICDHDNVDHVVLLIADGAMGVKNHKGSGISISGVSISE